MRQTVSLRIAATLSALLLPAGPVRAQDAPPASDNDPVDNAEPAAPAGDPGVFSPKRHDWSRYEKMADKSPFEFELIEGPAEAAPSPFADITLAGFVGSGSNITAFLVDSKKNERIPVHSEASGRKNESGFKVIGVNRGHSLRDTTVTLEKNGVVDTLGIDATLLSTMVAGGAAPAIPGAAPGQQGAGNRGRGRGPVQPVAPGAAARTPYQAPAAVVAGRNTTTLAGAQVQPQAVNAANAGQNVNVLVNNAGTPQQGQPAVVVGAGGNPAPAANNNNNGGRRREANQVRRRVVLPNAR